MIEKTETYKKIEAVYNFIFNVYYRQTVNINFLKCLSICVIQDVCVFKKKNVSIKKPIERKHAALVRLVRFFKEKARDLPVTIKKAQA